MKRLARTQAEGFPGIFEGKKKKAKQTESYERAKLAARQFEEYIGETPVSITSGDCVTETEVENLCRISTLKPILWESKSRMYNEARQKLQRLATRRKAYAVCDRAFKKTELSSCRPKVRTAERWRTRLCGSNVVSLALCEQYGVAEWYPELKGALLSKEGLDLSENIVQPHPLLVFPQCLSSMKSGTSTKPPKFSIANGFDIGLLPAELSSARSIERRLTTMIRVAHSVTVLKGGKYKSIKGHVSFMRTDPTPVAKKLPRLLQEVQKTCLVIMTRKLTPLQKILAMKRHETRVDMVRLLLEFYIQ